MLRAAKPNSSSSKMDSQAKGNTSSSNDPDVDMTPSNERESQSKSNVAAHPAEQAFKLDANDQSDMSDDADTPDPSESRKKPKKRRRRLCHRNNVARKKSMRRAKEALADDDSSSDDEGDNSSLARANATKFGAKAPHTNKKVGATSSSSQSSSEPPLLSLSPSRYFEPSDSARGLADVSPLSHQRSSKSLLAAQQRMSTRNSSSSSSANYDLSIADEGKAPHLDFSSLYDYADDDFAQLAIEHDAKIRGSYSAPPSPMLDFGRSASPQSPFDSPLLANSPLLRASSLTRTAGSGGISDMCALPTLPDFGQNLPNSIAGVPSASPSASAFLLPPSFARSASLADLSRPNWADSSNSSQRPNGSFNNLTRRSNEVLMFLVSCRFSQRCFPSE